MSIVRRLDKIPRIHKVVTDEAHHAPARSWLKIYKRIGELLPDWQHLGVTATPIRTKGASDLEAIFGKPVYVKSIFELIVEGYLSPLKGMEVRTESLWKTSEFKEATSSRKSFPESSTPKRETGWSWKTTWSLPRTEKLLCLPRI